MIKINNNKSNNKQTRMDIYSVLMTFTIVVNTYTHIILDVYMCLLQPHIKSIIMINIINVNRATVSKKYQYGQTPRVLEVKQRGSVGP